MDEMEKSEATEVAAEIAKPAVEERRPAPPTERYDRGGRDDRGGPRGGGGGYGGGGGGYGRGPRRDSGDRGDEMGGKRGGGGRRFAHRKMCQICAQKIKYIDYKDVGILRTFISDRGKIRPRRMTGTCAGHQRELDVAIKRARNIALLPFKA